MGFLTSIKKTFNISGAEVSVATDDDIHSQGDRVSGRVTVRAGEYLQKGSSIWLELKEFWTETHSAGKYGSTTETVMEARENVSLASDFSIQPGSEESYEFEVRLPMNCRISTEDTGWRLVVTMEMPSAVDPTGEVILVVYPAEEFVAIIQACDQILRFRGDFTPRWEDSSSTTSFRLVPPEVLKSELDSLHLNLFLDSEGAVTGTLIFDLEEESVFDYFKAIFGRDDIKRPLALSPDEIFDSDGHANSDAIARPISRALEEVLSERRAKGR